MVFQLPASVTAMTGLFFSFVGGGWDDSEMEDDESRIERTTVIESRAIRLRITEWSPKKSAVGCHHGVDGVAPPRPFLLTTKEFISI
jgi:hypothetical protein